VLAASRRHAMQFSFDEFITNFAAGEFQKFVSGD
jgi:hypothetical protein